MRCDFIDLLRTLNGPNNLPKVMRSEIIGRNRLETTTYTDTSALDIAFRTPVGATLRHSGPLKGYIPRLGSLLTRKQILSCLQ
jgi:hypothetical protein